MTTVAIFGGGIGGLTAAHELAERGFEVTIYEKNEVCGGKARSLEKPNTGTGGRRNLPGEHGFRFFPGFYQHLDDTMKRIPIGANNAYQNLVDAHTFLIAQEGKEFFEMPTDSPSSGDEWLVALQNFFGNPALGLAPGENQIIANRILHLLTMCKDRRLQDYECVSWWKFHDADNRSDQYQKMFVDGFSRAFVAMAAKEASTWTGGNIISQFFKVFFQTGTMDRVLNGPTNDVWIDPWVKYLQTKNVTINRQHRLTDLTVKVIGGKPQIDEATVEDISGANPVSKTVTADYYIAAMPVEAMSRLVDDIPALQTHSPSLAKIGHLKVSWMNGIVYYLKNDLPNVAGHINFADSNWALTGISQAQFWTVPANSFGDGTIKGILSIVISDWGTEGDKLEIKTARACDSAQEIADETWAQLVPHLPADVKSSLTPDDPVDFFLDPAVSFVPFNIPLAGARFPGPLRARLRKVRDFSTQHNVAMRPRGIFTAREFANFLNFVLVANAEPLLLNTTCSLVNRPEAQTEIGNLLLASDYVKTNIDLATMEGANEAGRRATNAILTATNSAHPHSQVMDYAEPSTFQVWQEFDQWLFDNGAGYLGPFPV